MIRDMLVRFVEDTAQGFSAAMGKPIQVLNVHGDKEAARLSAPDAGMKSAVARGHGFALAKPPFAINDELICSFDNSRRIDWSTIMPTTAPNSRMGIANAAVPIVS